MAGIFRTVPGPNGEMPTAESSDVVFTVSDQRQEQNFDVKIKFDTTLYPELKNGMSAKIWVYKK